MSFREIMNDHVDDKRRSERTTNVTRGVRRHLSESGFEGVREFMLTRALRCDLIAVNARGEIVIIEVKSDLADLRADAKWPGYWDWCDRLFFAVDADFPLDAVPEETGLLRADAFGAVEIRQSPWRPLAGARRKALLIRIATAASSRLRLYEDPPAG